MYVTRARLQLQRNNQISDLRSREYLDFAQDPRSKSEIPTNRETLINGDAIMTEKQSAQRPNRRSFLSGAVTLGAFSLLKAAGAEAAQDGAFGRANAAIATHPIAATEDHGSAIL